MSTIRIFQLVDWLPLGVFVNTRTDYRFCVLLKLQATKRTNVRNRYKQLCYYTCFIEFFLCFLVTTKATCSNCNVALYSFIRLFQKALYDLFYNSIHLSFSSCAPFFIYPRIYAFCVSASFAEQCLLCLYVVAQSFANQALP